MNRVSGGGNRFEAKPKLNIKKVAATLIAFLAIILVIFSIKSALTKRVTTKNLTVQTTYFTVYANNKWGVIDNEGKEIIKPSYDEMIVIPDKNKPIFICTYNVDYNAKTYSTKVLNEKGETIFGEYNKVEAIENNSNNKIWYETDILKYEKEGKYGLINYDGKLVLSPEYNNIYTIPGLEKSIIIEKDGKKGLVNSLGEIIINPDYKAISGLTSDYSNGYIVQAENDKYGIWTPDKKQIFEPKYDSIDHVYGSNMYVVVEEGNRKIVSPTGEMILDTGFDNVVSIDGEYIVAQKAEKFGVIDKTGADIIPAEYEGLKYCFDNNYIAKKDGKFGIIGLDNSVKVEFKYTKMDYVKSGNFIEADNEQYKTDIIDKSLKVALSNVIVSELNETKGFIRVRVDDKYKYYNFNLEEKKAQDVLPTRTLFLYKENGKYGYENNKGERIVDPIYDDAMEQNEYGYCAVKKDGKWGVLKSNGAVLLNPSVNLDNQLYVDFVADWFMYQDPSLNIYTK